MNNPTSAAERAAFAASLTAALAARPELDGAKLARQIGCTKQTMGRYLRGDRLPTVVLAYRMAQALGLTVEELVTGRVAGRRVRTAK